MIDHDKLTATLKDWATLVGSDPLLGVESTGREIWPVTAEDGRDYFLKRLGPWRNLPVADEARVLRWLSGKGIGVAEFMITDRAALSAGAVEDSFILIPQLASDDLDPAAVLASEESIGQAIAELHRALAGYPWPANSYTERLRDALLGELLLPADVAGEFGRRRDSVVAAIDRLPLQLVHGDLTPGNVVLRLPGEVSGFIDFDHLPLAPRVWDVAKYLSRRNRRRWQRGAPSTTGRLDNIAPVLRGYQQVSPLTEDEVAALPGLITAANIIEASYGQALASGVLERRMLPDHDEELADAIDAARWQLTHDDAMVDAVRAGSS